MDYAQPSYTTAPPTPLRLTSIAITFLALLTGLIYLLAITGDSHEGLGGETAVLLIIALLALLFSWKWLALGGLISLVAGVSIAALVYSNAENSQLFAALLYGTPFIVAGGLRLACWRQTDA